MSGKAQVLKKQVNEASRAEQQQPVTPVKTCPNKNWIELIYKYESRRAVSSASYKVLDTATNQSLASGCLDQMGFARVEGLPDSATNVKILFSSDPKPFEIYPGYKPFKHNLSPETTQIEDEDGTVISVAKWLGTSLSGDFADDQSYGQIAFGTVVTLIPIVDQVGDVRDITANLHRLTFRKQYNEFSPWFSLVVTIIGCVPEVGSVIKGVVKAIYKAVKNGAKKLPLTKLIRLLNSVGEGNVVRFLREFLEKIHVYGQEAAATLIKMLDAIKAKLENLRILAFSKAEMMIDELLESTAQVYRRVPEMVRKVIDWIAANLKNTLEDAADFVISGVTRARNGARQLKEGFIRASGAELKKLAARAGMKPEHIEKLAMHCQKKERMVVVRVSNPESLKYQGETLTVLGEQAQKLGLEGKTANFLPKPLDVKLKTAKGENLPENIRGLVTRPKEPMEQWERANIAELEKKGYWFNDETGVLHDRDGNVFYGDYDVQSVHRRVKMENPETGEMEDVYLNELSNPTDDVDVIAEMNKDTLGDLPENRRAFQHGAESDFRVKLDKDGKIIEDAANHPLTVSADEMNTGGRSGSQMKHGEDYKLGRQFGQDEKYLVVDADGNSKLVENPEELKELYDDAGLPWEYDASPATGPAMSSAAKAEAVAGAERARRENSEQK